LVRAAGFRLGSLLAAGFRGLDAADFRGLDLVFFAMIASIPPGGPAPGIVGQFLEFLALV